MTSAIRGSAADGLSSIKDALDALVLDHTPCAFGVRELCT